MIATATSVLSAVAITLISGPAQIAYGQDDDVMEEVVVTGSRIRRNLDSVMFTDLQVRYNPSFADDAVTITLGLNNLFDEDPSLCDACGVIGLSNVVHDLPGTVGYVRFSYSP
jgi:outer membrane receptor protein involved in Fe transport